MRARAQINQAFPASLQSNASFKWRDYSPVVFQHLREVFGLESRDYLLSLCGDRQAALLVLQLGSQNFREQGSGRIWQLSRFWPHLDHAWGPCDHQLSLCGDRRARVLLLLRDGGDALLHAVPGPGADPVHA